MAKSEIYGTHGLPRDVMSLNNKIQQVLHDVGKRRFCNGIQHKYSQRYARRVIERVNKEEEQKRKTRTGMIKVLVLSHNREKQIDPRIAWFMFQNIYLVYCNIK